MNTFHRIAPSLLFAVLLQLPVTTPLFPESSPFSVAQTAIFDDTISYQVSAETPFFGYRFASRAPTPPADQPRFPDFAARSWSAEFAPDDVFSVLAGSISWSGLPARLASPAREGLSPFASIAGVRAGATIRPSWAAGREYLGVECRTKYFGMVSFASPASPLEKPAWLQLTVGLPLKKDARPAFALSLFSGIAHRATCTEESWFFAEPALPERSILLPGAELAFDLGPFSGNLVGMANMGAFSPVKLAFTGDIGFAGKRLRAGLSCFLGDPSFVNLDGGILKIRQSGSGSCSVRFPLPGGPIEEIAMGATFAVKRTANLSMSEPGETLFSGGGELKLTLDNFRASLKSDTDEDASKISLRIGIPELISTILALDLSAGVCFPHNNFTLDTWTDGSLASKVKTGKFGPFSGDLQAILTKAKPDSPFGIELIAHANLSLTDNLANWAIVASISGKPQKTDYKGSLSVRADFP